MGVGTSKCCARCSTTTSRSCSRERESSMVASETMCKCVRLQRACRHNTAAGMRGNVCVNFVCVCGKGVLQAAKGEGGGGGLTKMVKKSGKIGDALVYTGVYGTLLPLQRHRLALLHALGIRKLSEIFWGHGDAGGGGRTRGLQKWLQERSGRNKCVSGASSLRTAPDHLKRTPYVAPAPCSGPPLPRHNTRNE